MLVLYIDTCHGFPKSRQLFACCVPYIGWKNPHFLFLFLFFRLTGLLDVSPLPGWQPPLPTTPLPKLPLTPISLLLYYTVLSLLHVEHMQERENEVFSLSPCFVHTESRFEMCPLRVSFALEGKYFRWKVQWPKSVFCSFLQKSHIGLNCTFLSYIVAPLLS